MALRSDLSSFSFHITHIHEQAYKLYLVKIEILVIIRLIECYRRNENGKESEKEETSNQDLF